MENKNIGELIISHYEKYLGNFVDAKIFAGASENFPIQLLKYENVIEDLKTFITIGFSKYYEIINNKAEIIFSINKEIENYASIFMNSLFFISDNKINFGRGTFIKGIEKIDSEFADKYNFKAIYFTIPFGVPEDFIKIEDEIEIYTAFFITESELKILEQTGTEEFEDYLEQNEIDIFDIKRAIKE